ncbi:hypothetical protein DDE84_07810 [Bifidobacterium tibiigranuli]|jgi:hypothetical protein|uniref:Uncharacterized protein n=1 Tax=Bifidobacterium tibiigranuli TaxID=2172043 RepID=A0A5N6RZK8_9BIFI|nr:hypothetical protein DDF78_09325 [Bifidobacterium tibiigranuli]KAE8127803.1 hypothetical protein DDE84_07810 [Bifidobacterium tibiigranuli]
MRELAQHHNRVIAAVSVIDRLIVIVKARRGLEHFVHERGEAAHVTGFLHRSGLDAGNIRDGGGKQLSQVLLRLTASPCVEIEFIVWRMRHDTHRRRQTMTGRR